MTNDMKKDVEKRKGKASLDCGTRGGWLWLLRSRPDQIHGFLMRGDPPRTHCTRITRRIQTGSELSFFFSKVIR